MAPSRADLLGRWGASPEIDEFFQSIEFRDDGTGTVRSAGGQALCLFANFRWDLEPDGRVELRFEETVKKPWPDYTPAEGARLHHVRCELEVGEFPLRVPALMGTATYRRRLRFDESPLPKDAATYHAHSLFFSVVNHIDPRQFLLFYAVPPRPEDIVEDVRPVQPSWHEVLAKAETLKLARFPGEGEEMFEGTQWVRVVAGTTFVLEACIFGGGRAPIDRIDWYSPGTKTSLGEASASGSKGLALRVGGLLIGEVTCREGSVRISAADGAALAREVPTALWRSTYARPDEQVLARRQPAIPNLERYGSEVELNSAASAADRMLLVLACLVALDRDTTSERYKP